MHVIYVLNLKTTYWFFIDNKLEKLHSNVENCTRKVRAIINKWRKYNLTIMGRMTALQV